MFHLQCSHEFTLLCIDYAKMLLWLSRADLSGINKNKAAHWKFKHVVMEQSPGFFTVIQDVQSVLQMGCNFKTYINIIEENAQCMYGYM